MAAGRKSETRPEKLADFLEAAYDLAPDDQTWLRNVMEAALATWGPGRAAHGAIYDASDISAFRVETAAFVGLSEAAIGVLMRGLDLFTPSFVARTFRSLLANAVSEVDVPEMGPMMDELRAFGIVDALDLNGLDPSGVGPFLAMWTDRLVEISPTERELFRRMAHHFGAAQRVRRRLRASQPNAHAPDPTIDAEAIFDRHNRLLHAAGPAQSKAAREDLAAAVSARDRARASKATAGEGLRDWPPLTSARWSLVDRFEQSGARYVVARENKSSISGLGSLTDRERQAVVYLAIGQSTKETAYALGITDVTVRVLLGRAAAKLGVRSRAELFDHPEVRQLRPGEGALRLGAR